VSDGDDLLERYTGLVARFENTHVGTDRVRLRFQFESYHDQWNQSTLGLLPTATAATFADTSGIYRARQNFEPVATITLAKPLTLSFGASFERFQEQFPAAHTEAANALITTLRYHRRLEGSESQQDVDAGYGLRAATKTLGSDFVYGRHHFQVRYQWTHGKHLVLDDLTAGVITGQAPLFERYVLGNSSTLRGWNKYELDPLGGNRMVHNSVEYRYGVFQVFYDAGAIWDSGDTAVPRHSIGVGLRQGGFSLAMAFPVREGRVEPILMVGMNY
jgi:outer membrane translocation and assembly module TamA